LIHLAGTTEILDFSWSAIPIWSQLLPLKNARVILHFHELSPLIKHNKRPLKFNGAHRLQEFWRPCTMFYLDYASFNIQRQEQRLKPKPGTH